MRFDDALGAFVVTGAECARDLAVIVARDQPLFVRVPEERAVDERYFDDLLDHRGQSVGAARDKNRLVEELVLGDERGEIALVTQRIEALAALGERLELGRRDPIGSDPRCMALEDGAQLV